MSLLKHLLALSMCVSVGASCAQASPLGANFSTINQAFSTNFSTDHLIGAGLHFINDLDKPASLMVKHDDWDERGKGKGHHKNKHKAKKAFPGNSIQACISRHDNGRWSRPQPIELHIAQAGIVSDFFSIMLGTSGMHIVVNDDNFFGRIILPLNGHDLSDRETIYYDTDGRPWRISKSWKKCKRK